MRTLSRYIAAILLCCLASLPACAQEDGTAGLTPTEFAAGHGITWPMPLPTADERRATLAAVMDANALELYQNTGFDAATCNRILDAVKDGRTTFHAPIATAADIPELWDQAGINHCPQNNPLLNPGREWTILTKYYKQVTAIPDWRDWPTDKSTLYEAQFNIVLYSPYPEAAAQKGPNLLFFAEGICRPSDRYICLSPRYKLFNPQSCTFFNNFMVDARYTPRDKKRRTAHDGVMEIGGDVFIYDFVADSAPDAPGPARNGRFRLREIHDTQGRLSQSSCQFGTPDYVAIWRRYHKPAQTP